MAPECKNDIPLTLLIRESINGNPKMQQLLYNRFAPAMYRQCLRYTKNTTDAEDLLQEGFIRIFSKLDKYRGDGSFEGWLKKIMLRTVLTHFRRTEKKVHNHQRELCHLIEDRESNIFDTLAQKDIIKIVTTLPTGYRTVFTMFVIEGYNHREIAGILGFSEENSKSQLSRSKLRLRKMLLKTI